MLISSPDGRHLRFQFGGIMTTNAFSDPHVAPGVTMVVALREFGTLWKRGLGELILVVVYYWL